MSVVKVRCLLDVPPADKCRTQDFNSIKFSFIYIAPNYNKSHLKAVN